MSLKVEKGPLIQEKIGEFQQQFDHLLKKVNGEAFRLLENQNDSGQFLSRASLERAGKETLDFADRVHQYVVERARFLKMDDAIKGLKEKGLLLLPKNLFDSISNFQKRHRKVVQEYWTKSDPEGYRNIADFVGAFNTPSGFRGDFRKQALEILERLRDKVWIEREDVKIPDRLFVANTRNAYFQLYRCDDAIVKEMALTYLIELLECDPMSEETAFDLVILQKNLLEEIQGDVAQNLTIKLQRLLIKAFALSLESILMHAAAKHLNALFEDTKIQIWDGAANLGDFNVTKDEEIKFWVEYAVQGAQHIKSNVSEMKKWLKRLWLLAKSGLLIAVAVNAPETTGDVLQTIVTDLMEAFSHFEWRQSWFQHLMTLRKLTRYALYNPKAFRDITPIFQKIKKEGDNDQVLYGVVSTLEYTALMSPCPEIQEESLKLLLQYATYDDVSVQKRVIQAFLETLSSTPHLRNTGFILLKLLEGGNAINDKQLWSDVKHTPAYLKLQKNLDTGQVYDNVIKFLLRRLADIKGEKDFGGHSFVTLLCSSPNDATVPGLLRTLTDLSERFQEPDVYGNTPYHIAVEHGNYSMLGHINANLNVNIDQRNNRTESPLHIAVRNNDKQGVAKLLELGANPNGGDKAGNTPLHLAVMNGSHELVELLIKKGARKSMQNNSGKTPLNVAIQRNDALLVDLLMRHNGVIAEHVHQMTPLIVATRECSEDVLIYLIDRKKDELTLLEAYEIIRMISPTGLTINASEEFCQFHLEKMASSELYRTSFAPFANLPHIVRGEDGQVELSERKKYTDFGNQKLIMLAKEKRKGKRFRSNLKRTKNVDQTNYFGLTPLHVATISRNYRAVASLLKKNADTHAVDIRGFTPLHFAAYMQDVKMVRLLLEHGANPRAVNDYGDTPLHIACGNFPDRMPETLNSICSDCPFTPLNNDPRELIELLIERGASLRKPDNLGNNALHHAALHGTPAVVQLLIERDPELMWSRNRKGLLPIEEAVEARRNTHVHILLHRKSLKELHEEFVEMTGNRLTLGNLLARIGDQELFDQLLTEDPDLAFHQDGPPFRETPLHVAANRGKPQILDSYRNYGLRIDIQDGFGNTAAHLAALREHLPFLEKLKNSGANLRAKNKDGRTPMHLAAKKGKTKSIRKLFEYDPRLALEKDGNGSIPLHLACKFEQLKTVAILCEQFPQTVGTTDDDLNTPLHYASGGDWKIVNELVKTWKAEKDARNLFGETPFILAALHGNEEVVGYLSMVGADFRAQDIEGETALHKAVFKQHIAIIKKLLSLDSLYPKPPDGTLPDIADMRGESSLHELTKLKRCEEDDKLIPIHIMHLLLKAGADVTKQNEKGETFLHLLCLKGMHRIFKEYLQTLKPSQVKMLKVPPAVDHDKNNLLHKACEGGSLEAVKLLRKIRFPFSFKNKKGQTGLLIAVKNGNYGIARYLRTKKARINVTDKKGRNVIHLILDKEELGEDDIAYLREVVENHSELINARDGEMRTPLHLIAERGHHQVLDLILQNLPGPEERNERFIWKKDSNGRTAMDIAHTSHHVLESRIRRYSKDQLG